MLWEPCVLLLSARWAATGVPAIQTLVMCDGGITSPWQSEHCMAPAKLRPSNLLLVLSQGFSVVNSSPANAGYIRNAVSETPGLGRSPGEGRGNPLYYSCLENPMDRGAWRVTVHRVTKSRTKLSDLAQGEMHRGL